MATGTVIARLFTSYAVVPIADAIVTFSQRYSHWVCQSNAVRISDQNGITAAVEIETPPFSESQTPQPFEQPWANVDITAEHPSYNRIIVTDVKVFADTVTQQDLQLIPQDEFPEFLVRTNVFSIPPYTL